MFFKLIFYINFSYFHTKLFCKFNYFCYYLTLKKKVKKILQHRDLDCENINKFQ